MGSYYLNTFKKHWILFELVFGTLLWKTLQNTLPLIFSIAASDFRFGGGDYYTSYHPMLKDLKPPVMFFTSESFTIAFIMAL